MKKIIAMVIATLLSLSMITACTNNGTQNESSNSSNEANSSDLSESSSVADETSDVSTESEASSEDIALKINEYLDIILQNTTYTDEEDLASYTSDEFSAIIELGEDAFPALDEIIDNEDNSYDKRAFALHAKYTIKPELYDLSFPSPDEKYAVKCSVATFYQGLSIYGNTNNGFTYNNIRLVDLETDSVIANSDISEMSVDVQWSEDSKYAAISYGDQLYHYETNVFDVQNAQYIELPTSDNIKELSDFNEDVTNFSAEFEEWSSADEIKISVLLKGSEGKSTSGWYVYDLIEQKIVDSEF